MHQRAALVLPVVALAACSSGPGVATGTTVLPLTGGTPTGSVVTPSPSAAATHGPSTVVTFVTTPVQRGRRATLTATTAPHAECSATVTYPGTSVHASALGRRQATAAGSVSWTWTVASRTPSGDWPLTVTCTPGGEAATLLAVA
jgi:hypothetical protein